MLNNVLLIKNAYVGGQHTSKVEASKAPRCF
jgi:hypothetical protein